MFSILTISCKITNVGYFYTKHKKRLLYLRNLSR